MIEDEVLTGVIPDEVMAASIIERIIKGEEIEKRVGEWGIKNVGLPRLVAFDYHTDPSDDPAATFVFDVENRGEGTFIKFVNTHRIVHDPKRRRQGIGSRALTSLESILGLVVANTGNAITIEFSDDNQDGTRGLLKKFKYQPQERSPTTWNKTITNL